MLYFNPRSPRGGATYKRINVFALPAISIHAPHEGERPGYAYAVHHRPPFQSTLPTRGSDAATFFTGGLTLISIHAPHEGERRNCACRFPINHGISIHAPHEGERPPAAKASAHHGEEFQSTLPTRGSDVRYPNGYTYNAGFQSTLPTRGSDMKLINDLSDQICISIHAPHEGERQAVHIIAYYRQIQFQSTLPTRGSDLRSCAYSRYTP